MINTVEELLDYQIEYFSRPGAGLAKDYGGTCMYRDDDTGNKCAIGCLVPDELYEHIEPFEGESVDDNLLNVLETLDIIGIRPYDVDEGWLIYLRETQSMHDSDAENASDLVRRLREYKERVTERIAT